MVYSEKFIELGGGFFHGPFIGDGIAAINAFSLVPDHFHRVATGNIGALKIADGASTKIVGNPFADFHELFGFAGPWGTWKKPDGTLLESFIIATPMSSCVAFTIGCR